MNGMNGTVLNETFVNCHELRTEEVVWCTNGVMNYMAPFAIFRQFFLLLRILFFFLSR